MSDLVDFLNARLDDEEQAARAAVSSHEREPRVDPCTDGGRWVVRYGDYGGTKVVDGDGHDVVAEATDRGGAVRSHIARHDPARVLAEVESKHRILHEHRDGGDGRCYGCGFGNNGKRLYRVDECPTKRFLAWPYADHPEFRTEWRP